MKPYKRILIGLVLASLTACGTLSQPPSRPAKPDPAWTEQVPEPAPPIGRDNAALAAWTKALRQALAEANANIAAVKRWSEGL